MSKNRNVVPLGTRQGATARSKTVHEAGHSRSREPVTRSRMTVRGRFPSAKIGRMVDWESQLERRACYRFEFSTAVLSFHEQPAPIRFWVGEKYTKYTPDFELCLSNGETWFVEIKPYDHLQREDLSQRLSFASECYLTRGHRFIVITDEELIHPVLESNLTHLKYFQTHELSETTIEHAHHWLQQAKDTSLGEMLEYFGDKVTAYALLCQSHICSDLSVPFSLNSELYLPEEDNHATLLFSYRTAPHFEISAVYDLEDSRK